MGEDRSGRRLKGAFRLRDEDQAGEGRPSRARRLYGRSKGKGLRRRQSDLLRELLPKLSLDSAASFPDACALFSSPTIEARLEIGFGGGEHLIEAAAREPEVGFVGCEPFINGMARLLSRIEERGLGNIRLFAGDAALALERFPAASLARVYLYYPDPWPKRRQRKRRFISAETLALLARVMRSGAELRFSTDVDDYAAWTLARLRGYPDFQWRAERAADWLTPWVGWVETKYERKALAAGRRPVYLTFVRN
jgi:tRNA (guanine-N7-)-methyltransferase